MPWFGRRIATETIASVARILAAVAIAVMAALAPPAIGRPVTPRGDLTAEERLTIDLFDRAKRSVVYISTSEKVRDFWTRNVHSIPRGTGSGFVWDEHGHVITNLHVVAGASEARIRLNDGRDYPASLVGASELHDLAVLRITVPSNKPPPLPVGTSHDLKVGQRVYAIGNPFGLDWTLTTGIVSALDRSLGGENGNSIEHLIQTDAAINPGNSGGPLLDSAGRLIGMNTAIYSPSGASAGIGFAVPIDTVNRVAPALIAHGKYMPPSLGIEFDEDLNTLLRRRLGVDGVFVLKVNPESPAAKAGLRAARIERGTTLVPGDVITDIGDKPTATVPRLLARLDDFSPGDKVRIGVLRDGKKFHVELILAAGR
jgi:S1-C subfamily serine protease